MAQRKSTIGEKFHVIIGNVRMKFSRTVEVTFERVDESKPETPVAVERIDRRRPVKA